MSTSLCGGRDGLVLREREGPVANEGNSNC